MEIIKKKWGQAAGSEVYLFELAHCGVCARVSNYGGVLQALYVENAFGEKLDVVLGYDTLAEYQASETFFGAMVGPVADRIRCGSFEVGDKQVQLPLNAGPDTMHSGPGGFHAKVWNWELLPDGIAFMLDLPEDQTGFPGTLKARLAYRIPAKNTLRIEYAAQCDHDIPLSFTNHSYFNLDGARNHCREHILTIHASHYAETEREVDPVCTGRALPVEATPFDFRAGCKLQAALARNDFREIRSGGGVDHYFLVDDEGMREHARIESPKSGLILKCRSDAPGVLVYSGNGLMDETGKGGCIYEQNFGICLETQRFPNGVNLPNWRKQVILPKNTPFASATEFVFDAKRPV